MRKLTEKAQQAIRTRVSAETFPRPTGDGVWLIDDIADYFDRTINAPDGQKAA